MAKIKEIVGCKFGKLTILNISEQGVFNLFFVMWAKNIHIENQHFIKKITNK